MRKLQLALTIKSKWLKETKQRYHPGGEKASPHAVISANMKISCTFSRIRGKWQTRNKKTTKKGEKRSTLVFSITEKRRRTA